MSEGKIETGDFVQLDTWFGDVWAEVTDSHDTMFNYIIYEKGGGRRWEVLEFSDKVRHVIKKADVEKNVGKLIHGVCHSQYEYLGNFGRHKYWGFPIERGKYKSSRPEEWKPLTEDTKSI
jgi:hypothetical protein